MNTHISKILFLPLTAFFILMMMEFMMLGFMNIKVNDLSEYAIKTAENSGGFTASAKSKIENRMINDNMTSSNYAIQYITDGKKNFSEEIQVNAAATFTFKTFNLLGTGIGNKTIQINSPNTGYSNVWYRN